MQSFIWENETQWEICYVWWVTYVADLIGTLLTGTQIAVHTFLTPWAKFGPKPVIERKPPNHAILCCSEGNDKREKVSHPNSAFTPKDYFIRINWLGDATHSRSFYHSWLGDLDKLPEPNLQQNDRSEGQEVVFLRLNYFWGRNRSID